MFHSKQTSINGKICYATYAVIIMISSAVIMSTESFAQSQNTVNAQPDRSVSKSRKTRSNEERVTLLSNDTDFTMAFASALAVLSQENSCSDFFRGSASATEVLTEFADHATKTFESYQVGIRMHGPYTMRKNFDTGTEYRLFEKMEINGNGSFYRQNGPISHVFRPVGRFAPGTKEARVLMLLHELGHLITNPSGSWLLPNDGDNPGKSRNNTFTVDKYCGRTISELAKSPKN